MRWIHTLNERVAGSKVTYKIPAYTQASAFAADIDVGLLGALLGRQLLPAESQGEHVLHRNQGWDRHLSDGEWAA
jgi:hypothetical protein